MEKIYLHTTTNKELSSSQRRISIFMESFSIIFYLFAEHFLCFWQQMGRKNGTTDSFARAQSETITHTENKNLG